jgi:hypothetical protein
MSTNAVDCDWNAAGSLTRLAVVGSVGSPHDAISTPAMEKARSEASTLGEDISTPDDSMFDTSFSGPCGARREPSAEAEFRAFPQLAAACLETAREFWEAEPELSGKRAQRRVVDATSSVHVVSSHHTAPAPCSVTAQKSIAYSVVIVS